MQYHKNKQDALYADWIKSHYPTPESAKLWCREATRQMASTFPELTRVRGSVLVGLFYRAHWWLIDQQGQIVDPTSHQFDVLITEYVPLPADAEEPIGKCINCGDLSFRSLGGQSHYCHECLALIRKEFGA